MREISCIAFLMSAAVAMAVYPAYDFGVLLGMCALCVAVWRGET